MYATIIGTPEHDKLKKQMRDMLYISKVFTEENLNNSSNNRRWNRSSFQA